ncbi:kinase-like domain-containing protein [Favolaschia claudopus]|uniref:Kinase-like domain-containing protein n=1 Tax=Favolaschia claudopus TaxID=2862362 RepID=A0AAW0A6X3_9AGAR
MYQTPRDPNLRRYFSTDDGDLLHGSPLVTDSTDGGGGGLSVSPIEGMPSSPAALFLSAFMQSPPAAALEPDAEGQIVGGFKLGPIIAHGGFSTIRRATSLSNGAVVAVKCVPKQRERYAALRIAHEESVWSSLSHEHILPLFAYIHIPTLDFFVTQLCPAGSLFDIMRGGVPTREDAGRMFRQIVRGLRYLHTEKRLVHRDIKLENVLVDEAGVCRIADFGMAKFIDISAEDEPEDLPAEPAGMPIPGGGIHRAASIAVPRSALPRRERDRPTTTVEEFQPGSLPYAAPELLGAPPRAGGSHLTTSASMSAKTKADALAGKSSSAFVPNSKSGSAFVSHAKPSSPALPGTAITHSKHPLPAQDMWALGVLLYALLMGRLPFTDSFEPRLVLKILSGTYAPPTNVNARTLAILHGCLAARVQERWTVERVDEAAWGVGGADAHVVGSPERSAKDVEEHGKAHAAKHHTHELPIEEPPQRPVLDRGRRSDAAMRRAERSSSRVPYSASVSRTRTRAQSKDIAREWREEGRRRQRSGSGSVDGMERRRRPEESPSHSRNRNEDGSESREGSISREDSGSRSRSRSPGPRTPPPLVGLGLMGIGLGYPSSRKGGANGSKASVIGAEEGAGASGAENEEDGDELGDVLGQSLLLSPGGVDPDLAVEARGTAAHPWLPRAGPGAGRSRSLILGSTVGE